jgi:hypothetical protein
VPPSIGQFADGTARTLSNPSKGTAMYDLIIRRLNEDGTPAPGWRRSRPQNVGGLRDYLVDAGVSALKALPQSSPRRAEVLAWTKRAGDDGILPAGTYPLGRGKAAMVIENATPTAVADAQARSNIAVAETRVSRPQRASSPKTVAEMQSVIRDYRRRAGAR